MYVIKNIYTGNYKYLQKFYLSVCEVSNGK